MRLASGMVILLCFIISTLGGQVNSLWETPLNCIPVINVILLVLQ